MIYFIFPIFTFIYIYRNRFYVIRILLCILRIWYNLHGWHEFEVYPLLGFYILGYVSCLEIMCFGGIIKPSKMSFALILFVFKYIQFWFDYSWVKGIMVPRWVMLRWLIWYVIILWCLKYTKPPCTNLSQTQKNCIPITLDLFVLIYMRQFMLLPSYWFP